MNASLVQATVLIVDDFQGMRTMLRDFVKSMGVTKVDTASSGKDTISQLGGRKYDIVICDYNLGSGQNGQQILEEAKMRNLIGVSTIWVMVTAEKTQDMVMGAAEVKPDDYLLKPINQVLLESRLEKLIARKLSLKAIEAAIKAKDYPEAIVQCDRQLAAKVLNPQEVLRIKSDLFLTMGDYEAATALFGSVLAVRSVPWAKTGLGKIDFHARKYASAQEMFRQVVTENPMYLEATDWLAKACMALGDTVQAQQVLLNAVKVSPNSPTRQKSLGDAAYRNGELDVARAAFEKNIRISEFSPHKNAAVYAGLAKVFSEQDAPLEALKVLAQSKKEFKYNPEAAIQTAAAESVVYSKMGEPARANAAMTEAERLLEIQGGKLSAEVAIDLAKSLFKLGRKDKACALLREVVKNNHENGEISKSVEGVFQAEGLATEGQAIIEESRREVVNINNQGVILAKNGDFQGGVNLLRAAAQKLPNNEVILVNLCGLLIALMSKSGKSDALAQETRDLLDRVQLLNPASKKYHAYVGTLNRIMGGKLFT
jgi:tetratricopeptide (TPR) repeat protein